MASPARPGIHSGSPVNGRVPLCVLEPSVALVPSTPLVEPGPDACVCVAVAPWTPELPAVPVLEPVEPVLELAVAVLEET